MDQKIIDRAVNIATRSALNCHPVKRVIWMPPTLATQDPIGSFAIEYPEFLTTPGTPPWEE
jgi:hypothetical protein